MKLVTSFEVQKSCVLCCISQIFSFYLTYAEETWKKFRT